VRRKWLLGRESRRKEGEGDLEVRGVRETRGRRGGALERGR